MIKKNLENLENISAQFSIVMDLVYIVIDFIENECPSKSERGSEEFILNATCYANRSSMFCHSLEAAYRWMLDMDKKLEEIIGSEIKNRKDK